MSSKKCAKCKENKSIEEFSPAMRRSTSSYCKQCAIAKTKEWKNRHPTYRRYRNLKDYGLTIFEYEDMLEWQGGACLICREVNINGKALHVDHDHVTGRIRGLLCSKCNTGLGLFNDNLLLLEQAMRYLRGDLDMVVIYHVKTNS